MRAIRKIVVGQFHRPHGLLGRLAGWIMATRPSNLARNDWTVSLLCLDEQSSVCEIGCGPGVALAAIAGKAIRGQIYAFDHSALMVRITRRRLREAVKAGRAVIEVAGWERVSDLPMPVDAVLSVNVFHFIDDKAGMAAAVLEALKPGGQFAVTHQPRGQNADDASGQKAADATAAILEAAGFGAVRIETLALSPPARCVIGVKTTRSH